MLFFGKLFWQAAALALLVGASLSAAAATIHVEVCVAPTTGPRDGSAANPFDSVAAAVQKAGNGDTILINGGLYPETGGLPLVINRSMAITAQSGAAVVGMPAASQKICQLTGETDLERNQFIGTDSIYGLSGVDLGSSVEYNGRIYFLFGDTIPNGSIDTSTWRTLNNDAVAWVPATSDPEQGLHLNFLTAPDGKYSSPKIMNSPSNCGGASDVDVSAFNVPGGGFSTGSKLYVFYTTCWNGSVQTPLMGKSLLVRLDDEANNCFTRIYTMSCLPDNANCSSDGIPVSGKFINVAPVVVTNSDFPEIPQASGQGVLLFGSGRYRQSDVYLAWLPLAGVENRQNLYYWGTNNAGAKGWVGSESAAISLFDTPQPCVGELSVSWNPYLGKSGKWIMLYNNDAGVGAPRGINYRLADTPTGPWSGPAVLFDPWCDRAYTHFMHYGTSVPCDTVYDNLQPPPPNGDPNRSGGIYAPYIISHFTRADATTTTMYWNLSTWNPYQVMLMKTRLRRSDGGLAQ